jgi:hypothetical protein
MLLCISFNTLIVDSFLNDYLRLLS